MTKNERKWSWYFGQEMKMFRKDNNIPLKVFAYDVGYSQQHILMLEKGEAKFNLENMDRISAVMGKTLKIDLVEGKMEKCHKCEICGERIVGRSKTAKICKECASNSKKSIGSGYKVTKRNEFIKGVKC